MTSVFSVGHSDHPWGRFVELLRAYDIAALVDVRSSPRSRYAHFSKVAVQAELGRVGIGYFYLGSELGGRPRWGGAPDYEEMAKNPAFHAGLDRLEEIAAHGRVAIMCAEAEPLQCHRFLLVGRRLAERGVTVAHILRDGRVERHSETEDRLLRVSRQTERDLFASRVDRLARAYRDQNMRLWRPSRR